MGRLITSEEKEFRDAIALESVQLKGTMVKLFSMQQLDSIGDDQLSGLYGEPNQGDGWDYEEYEDIPVFVEEPNTSPTVDLSGYIEVKNIEIFFAKVYFDDNSIPYPKEGDVIYHIKWGYMDVEDTHKDDYYSDDGEDYYVTLRCECVRNSKFEPTDRLP